MKVLIVDDNKELIMLIDRYLEKLDIDLSSCLRGKEDASRSGSTRNRYSKKSFRRPGVGHLNIYISRIAKYNYPPKFRRMTRLLSIVCTHGNHIDNINAKSVKFDNIHKCFLVPRQKKLRE